MPVSVAASIYKAWKIYIITIWCTWPYTISEVLGAGHMAVCITGYKAQTCGGRVSPHLEFCTVSRATGNSTPGCDQDGIHPIHDMIMTLDIGVRTPNGSHGLDLKLVALAGKSFLYPFLWGFEHLHHFLFLFNIRFSIALGRLCDAGSAYWVHIFPTSSER